MDDRKSLHDFLCSKNILGVELPLAGQEGGKAPFSGEV